MWSRWCCSRMTQEHALHTIAQSAASFGLTSFSCTPILSPTEAEFLGTLETYCCFPRKPSLTESELIEQAAHLAARCHSTLQPRCARRELFPGLEWRDRRKPSRRTAVEQLNGREFCRKGIGLPPRRGRDYTAMYKSFFGLRENPFNINPDPRFLHRTPRIQEALEQLTYGVQNRKGLLLLTGEVGTGKTTLINHLLDWLRERKTPTAFIFNSHLKVNHLFDFILNDFGISTDFHLVSNMLLELNQWLIKRFRAGSTPVLIVDEAQGLSFELLEEIRLLLNLETASEKLLQIVLVGQPELEEKLKRPEMRQLRQRIALRCNTSPLTLDESHGYIADRLRIAGATPRAGLRVRCRRSPALLFARNSPGDESPVRTRADQFLCRGTQSSSARDGRRSRARLLDGGVPATLCLSWLAFALGQQAERHAFGTHN